MTDGPEVLLLGRHHVLTVLAEDELGTINLARLEGPSGFQRWVSLRIVNRTLSRDPDFVRTFYHAARLGGQVTHANVAQTLEVGETQGTLWMAMEYLHGEPLEDLILRAREYEMPLPWDIACRIVSDVAFGVDALHEVRRPGGERIGLVHGHITPRQVTVTYDGKTKVLGMPVQAVGRAWGGPRELSYTAPEVAFGGRPTVRSDVYSIGVLLWELVSGHSLFAGETEPETRAKIRAHVVPQLRPMSLGCPERIDRVVERALAVDEKDRFANARELGQALLAALVSEALVVTDDDVGRYVLKLFGDTFEEREDRLRSASEVTEVFARLSMPEEAVAPPMSHPRLPPIEADATVKMPEMRELPEMPPITARMLPPSPSVPMLPPVQEPSYQTPPPHAAASTPPPHTSTDPSRRSAPTVHGGRRSRGVLPAIVLLGTAAVVGVTAFGLGRRGLPASSFLSTAPAASPPSALPQAQVPSPPASEPSLPLPGIVTAAAPQMTRPAESANPPAVAPPSAAPQPQPPPQATAKGAPRPPRPSRGSGGGGGGGGGGATGLVSIICVPACDQVWDGSRSLGPSPILKAPLSVGTHRIRMKINDPPSEKFATVDVVEDDTKVLRQSMQ